MRYFYEVLWYIGNTEEEAMQDGEYDTKTFSSKKAALNYYEKHKNDARCFGWWVTKRDEEGLVVEDYVY